ncbi:MAG: Stp1/IreP family PP2C-type Ser/Thr phosphatase [Bdellovibrionales bacterium]|nr:Stp1/IreP family PP2C-type Ser/Thr phosphatase [Bdellovibrionales bacterium]
MDVGSEESAGAKGIPCRCVVLTDVGKRRQENQDSYGYLHTPKGSLFLVADGMGGAQGGATASALAIEVIGKRALTAAGGLSPESLVTSIRLANSAIHEHAKSSDKLSGMGTTLVALAIFSDKAMVAHVGDSRIYLLKNDKLTQLTRDHTLVQELMDAGTISAEQAENHPISHMLTRSIGPTPNVDVELQIFPLPLTEGDRFLLCCDGLTNHVEDVEIQRILEAKDDLRDAAEMLIELANQRGGTDNITVQLVEVCEYEDSARKELSDGKIEFVKSSEIKFDEDVIPDMPDLGDSMFDTGDVEEDEHQRTNGEDTSGSAVDSILFGENPTTEDVRNHEKRSEKKLRAEEAIKTSLGADEDSQPTVEGEIDSPGAERSAEDDEEEDEFSFLDKEEVATKDEEQSFKQVQMLGITVIAVAVVAVILVVVGQTSQRVRLNDVGTEPQIASNPPEVTETVPSISVTDAEVIEPEHAPEAVEPTTEPGEASKSIDVPAATVVVPEDRSGSSNATEPSPTESSSGAEAEAWPTSNVIPDNNIEDDVKAAASHVDEKAAAAASERLESKKQVIKQKIDVRRSIEDENYRLALLTLPSQLDVVKRKEKLTAELAEIDNELSKGKSEIASEDSAEWKMRKTSIEAGNFLEVAQEVAPQEEKIKGLVQMYEAAKMLSDNASSAAEASPGDESLSSRKLTLGTELETQKQNLIAELTKTVDAKIAEQRIEASDPFAGYIDESSLKMRKQQIERKLEVINSLTWGLSLERLEQQVKIEAKKKEFEKKLWELSLKVSDEEEDKILKSLSEDSEAQKSAPTPEQSASEATTEN